LRILVINSGSSSIKFSMYEAIGVSGDPKCLYDGELSAIGEAEAKLELTGAGGADLLAGRGVEVGKAASAAEAAGKIFEVVRGDGMPGVEAVGYRVVHPGAKIHEHVRITDEVLAQIEEAGAFAPLHDPEAVKVIREGMKLFADVGHYACFDTVFHQTMPVEATTYPLPEDVRAEGVRRYGFHGLSCESIVWQMRAAGELPKRMAIAHLGSGCSVTAVVDGYSVDTSMGLTPTGGVVMGTRPGDLDPGLVLYLLRTGDGVDAVEKMLNHKAGMVGLSEMENDVKAVRAAAAKGDEKAQLSLKVFTRSVRKVTGGYAWLMGGLDAVVFSGGIGEHDALTRAEVLSGLETIGVKLDTALNAAKENRMRRVSASDSTTKVFVVPAQEDLMIAVHVDEMVRTGK
jgi:acetate kinase